MEKKHDLLFCPECGVKLDGDEIICAVCGYKLAELHPVQNSAQPVAPPPIPIQETPVIPPPIVETPPPPPVNEPTALTFCPNCGNKVEPNELFCNECGFRISDATVNNNDAPPIVPPPPSVNQTYPPSGEQNIYQQPQQPYYPPAPAKKKGMGAAGWILIILLIIIVVGGGITAFLQYNGNVNIEFLNGIIPAKESQNTTKVDDPTRYYVVHSFGLIGTKWNAIISDVVVSRQKFNNEEGAKNQFKLAIENKFPNDYHNFYDNVISNQYMTYPAAQAAHSSILKTYGIDPKGYTIQTVTFAY